MSAPLTSGAVVAVLFAITVLTIDLVLAPTGEMSAKPPPLVPAVLPAIVQFWIKIELAMLPCPN